MLYIPSPITISYDFAFQAMANASGRMQYYRAKRGQGRERITRYDFIDAYNKKKIIALRPKPAGDERQVFQIEFFTLDE